MEGQRQREPVGGVHPPRLDHPAPLGEKVAVVEERALGTAGGPRRVDDQGRALRAETGVGGGSGGAGQAGEVDDVADPGMGGAQPGDAVEPRGVGDDERRLGVAEDVRDLGLAVVGVDRHHDRAGAESAEAGEHPVARGGAVEEHPLPRPGAEPGEPGGHLLDRGGEPVVAQLPARPAERDAGAAAEQRGGQVPPPQPPPRRLGIRGDLRSGTEVDLPCGGVHRRRAYPPATPRAMSQPCQ